MNGAEQACRSVPLRVFYRTKVSSKVLFLQQSCRKGSVSLHGNLYNNI